MTQHLWHQCLESLRDEFPAQQFNMWIRPLQLDPSNANALQLIAPNRFVRDWVQDKFLARIKDVVTRLGGDPSLEVRILNGAETGPAASRNKARREPARVQPKRISETTLAQESGFANTPGEFIDRADTNTNVSMSSLTMQPSANITQTSSMRTSLVDLVDQAEMDADMDDAIAGDRSIQVEGGLRHQSSLNPNFTFESFVQGKSNQLALAAAQQVADNPGSGYNPLFIYGGVGLGKTHLMHAVGIEMRRRNPNAKIVYLHSERFVADMVKALQLNAINDFKRYYRSVDALLIDDIQFFAGKERSQEEFFHTFNALLEGGQQMILTSDRYPKEISGVEERLKSRFGWGLTVAIEPPELETRVAILKKKAQEARIRLPDDAAFFLAQKIRSNVRELEGVLKRVIANAHFTGNQITTLFIKESLKDLLALQDKQVSIDNIQRVVAEYYKIKVADLHSKRRSRSVARPRQVAMSLAKELTNHSLPEIGNAFGGRDHTTVLHATRKIKELRASDSDIAEDCKNLLRLLTA